MKFDKAILIGIQQYKKSGMSRLDGPYSDVSNIEKFIKHDSINITKMLDFDDCKIKPTRTNIIHMMNNMYNDCKENDKVLIYYSGHGTNLRTVSKDEYDQNYDQAMNVMNNEYVRDNELYSYITKNIPNGVEVYVIMDCCHSGDILDLKHKLVGNKFKEIRHNSEQLKNKIVLISGCAFTQSTADAPKGGAFTGCLLKILTEIPNISYKDLYNELQMRLNYLKKWFGLAQDPQIFCSLKLDSNESLF